VIDLTRHYQGIDTRWTHRGELLVPVTFTAGLDYENMSERRKGYENFVMVNGAPQYGEQGALRRNERNLMWNVDPYLQTQWQLTDKLSLDAGVRYSSVWFDSNDYYITPGNGDDSGDASYHKWLPAGSLKYALTDAWNVYLSAGRGFETPTINELSYRSDNQSGLNFGLKPPPTTRWRSAVRRGSAMACSPPPCSRPIPIMRLWSTAAAAGAPAIKTPAKPVVRGWSWGWISSLARAGV
jgi:iron complex outermembrane receptor protein